MVEPSAPYRRHEGDQLSIRRNSNIRFARPLQSLVDLQRVDHLIRLKVEDKQCKGFSDDLDAPSRPTILAQIGAAVEGLAVKLCSALRVVKRYSRRAERRRFAGLSLRHNDGV